MNGVNKVEMTRDEFFLTYKGYAKILATKFTYEVEDMGIEFDDLYQVGCLALIECYDKYKSDKASYSTFAYWSVYYAMLDYLNYNNSLTYLPINLVHLSNYYRKKKYEFYLEKGRAMTIEEAIKLVSSVPSTKTNRIDEKYILMLEKIIKFHINGNQKSLSEFVNERDIEEFRYDSSLDSVKIGDLLFSTSNTEEEGIDRYFLRKAFECLASMPDDDISKTIFIDLMGLSDGIVKTKNSLKEKYNITTIEGINYHYKKVMKKIKENVL